MNSELDVVEMLFDKAKERVSVSQDLAKKLTEEKDIKDFLLVSTAFVANAMVLRDMCETLTQVLKFNLDEVMTPEKEAEIEKLLRVNKPK